VKFGIDLRSTQLVFEPPSFRNAVRYPYQNRMLGGVSYLWEIIRYAGRGSYLFR